VLRFLDARAGSYVVVQSRLLRLCVHGSGGERAHAFDDVRVRVVADVLARAAELRGIQVVMVVAFADPDLGQSVGARSEGDVLGFFPPVGRTDGHEVEQWLSGPPHVHVEGSWMALGEADGGITLGVQPVESADLHHADRFLSAQDPLAVRLALLARPHGQPVVVDREILLEATDTLQRWRSLVARWADQSSRPVPPDLRAAALAALDDDLDTGFLVTELLRLELMVEVPQGAKFETFLYLDRILGLDLARNIGRPPA
jgi:hypothetical protein